MNKYWCKLSSFAVRQQRMNILLLLLWIVFALAGCQFATAQPQQITPEAIQLMIDEGKATDVIVLLDKELNQESDVATPSKEKANLFFLRATAYSKLAQNEAALADYNRAIELDDSQSEYYVKRGLLFAQSETFEKAIDDWTKAIALSPDVPTIFHNRGLAYMMQDKPFEAIDDWSKAIKLDPQNPEYYFNRGSAYRYITEFAKAIDDLNRAIELRPDYSIAFYNRGLTYIYMGKPRQGVEDLKKYLTLEPNAKDRTEVEAEIARLDELFPPILQPTDAQK